MLYLLIVSPIPIIFLGLRRFTCNLLPHIRLHLLPKLDLSHTLTILRSYTANSGFYVSSFGTATSAALCRATIFTSSCQYCIDAAVISIVTVCPTRTSAQVWYTLCMVRYSNSNFVKQSDDTISFMMYKGKMASGEEITVKKLATDSRQGIREFWNEMRLFLKMQHKNLVQLLRCCVHGDELMLVHEYLRNTSLDRILFDKSKSPLLDWTKRWNIIMAWLVDLYIYTMTLGLKQFTEISKQTASYLTNI